MSAPSAPSPEGDLSPDRELATDHLTQDLGRRSRRGGVVLLAAQMVRVLGQMGMLVVLVRLLPPSAFGLLAMVAAIGLVLELVKDFGLSSATIQKSGITQAQVSALFWINAGVGAVLAALLFLAAPLIARFYGQPELESIARWLSIGFLVSGLTVQHWALLRRQMRFGAIAGMETAADLMSFAASIALAVSGAGYWALVVQRLIPPTVMLLASWGICRWRPSLPGRSAGVKALLGFGAGVTASQLAGAFARSVDQILIGWLWGPAVLGLYERTTRLLLVPINTINAPIYAAAMPALSRLLDEPVRYRSMFSQVMQKLGLLTMPAFALAAVTADWVVPILFGPSWHQAIPLVALFSVSATFLPVLMACGLLYLTQARTADMLRATMIDAAVAVAAILAGLPWGVIGVAASIAIVGLTIRMPIGFWLSARRGPVDLGTVWRAVAPPASIALAIAAIVGALRLVLPDPTPGAMATVAGTTLAVGLVGLLAWPETRREVRQLLSGCSARLRFVFTTP
ncbi:MAG: lipopolysaccharide biosynthesis protein [Proteobacteria bacterium]|nr:lipopolysaccharide biosynthesis protein [Pseudomonadota bacterium]